MSNEELVSLIQSGINTCDNMAILYEQNIGFIKSVIKKFSYACQVKNRHKNVPIIEFEELMNEAYFGLAKAADKYDPNQGFLFSTYAAAWINQSAKRFLDNSGKVVRVPVNTQAKVYKYNQVKAYYLHTYNREPDTEEYAWSIDITVKAVMQLEKFMFQDRVKSLDDFIPGGEDAGELKISDSVASSENMEDETIEPIIEEQLRNELWPIVKEVLSNDNMNEIIRARFVDGLTYREIGEHLKISADMVRNYESNAIRRLRSNSRTKHLIAVYLVA